MKQYQDLVVVVRCKDCKYYKQVAIDKWSCKRKHALFNNKSDDFCSYGKRREG